MHDVQPAIFGHVVTLREREPAFHALKIAVVIRSLHFYFPFLERIANNSRSHVGDMVEASDRLQDRRMSLQDLFRETNSPGHGTSAQRLSTVSRRPLYNAHFLDYTSFL